MVSVIFRSKPHVIQGFRFDGYGTSLPKWFQDAQRIGKAYVIMNQRDQHVTINSKHGIHKAWIGDWVCINSSGTLFALSDQELRAGFHEPD